ncbi:hypothetical protein EJ377_17550 [Chryseobacterium arthrosphaerae]|uniref:Uncharacterized protein n=1 Tax=Chryseobacterium arthrosphaerae TaxID=651561 RepID=A0A3S0NKZ3_9FLAO|nr:hypothetical protein EJ377_17550 [Chryseobacterium arthrosphaerae]
MAILLAATGAVKSQVAIGNRPSPIHRFPLNLQTRRTGIDTSYVETKTGITDNGTIIYDTTTTK